jgi:transglutaminase-like putative cysteine protease
VPAVVWAAAFLASQLALRSHGPLAPVLPLLVAAVVPHFFGAGATAVHPLITAGAFVGACAALVALRASPRTASRNENGEDAPAPAGHRRGLAAAGVVAVVCLLAPVVGDHLPFAQARQPFDPRSLREPANLPLAFINPLAQVKARLSVPARPLFKVTTAVPGGSLPDIHVRLAVLDSYDGSTWTGPTGFLTAGPQLPADADHGPATVIIHQEVTIEQLDGYWVPVAGWPRSALAQAPRPGPFSGATGNSGAVTRAPSALAFDTSSGTLVEPTGLVPGLTFRITEDAPVYSAAALSGAAAVSGAQAARFVTLPPGQPDGLAALAQRVAGSAPSDFARAANLQEYLRKHFTNTVQAPAGHAYGQLARFLSDNPGGHAGTSEQFATAFAVLGRSLGLPTRVAVGFQPSSTGAGTHLVTNGDYEAWPEVWFQNEGWLAFDPTPPSGTKATPVVEQTNSAPAIAKNLVDASPSPGALTPAPTQTAGPAHGGAPLVGLLGLAVVAVLVVFGLAGLLVVAVKRRRRSARRLRGSIPARIRGAWAEAIERLSQRGLPPVKSLTATEVATAATEAVGPAGRSVAPLAMLLNKTLYDVEPPESGRAAEAWRLLDELEAGLAEGTSRVTRMRELVDPRPLLRR